ncbi:MAG: cbb3-type cytochrome oxidase assembly protein CcoS [Maritimibacter sp.]
MNILVYLIPISLLLGGLGLAAFFWTLRSSQYDDPQGDAERILSGEYDEAPPND